ncbi:MAG: DUF3108 domain-containing protein [Candidatus Thiodiazotropha sp. (ex Epidulcina cf. delphinae)]|nr:DUF3108 domain-containing protein [Candidatus Thiodiazotropha sp. (ex Epidulcina cf. delphinae)]
MILRIEVLSVALLLWMMAGVAGAAAPVLGEKLEYTLKFRGFVTGFVELDIARLTLDVEPELGKVADTPAYVTNLKLTTEPYGKAELLYPVRLSYRSWLDVRRLQPLIAVKSLKTREEREEFFWFDRVSGHAYHYQTGDAAIPQPQTPPASLQMVTALSNERWSSLSQSQVIEIGDAEALDYISFLHRLRRMPLESGKGIDFSVYNGKELEWFHADVSRERLVRAGWNLPAYRLRLWEVDPQSGKRHGEVELWLSDDEKRLLLRFYAERVFGAMEGILETGRPENGHDEGLSEATRSSLDNYLDLY